MLNITKKWIDYQIDNYGEIFFYQNLDEKLENIDIDIDFLDNSIYIFKKHNPCVKTMKNSKVVITLK